MKASEIRPLTFPSFEKLERGKTYGNRFFCLALDRTYIPQREQWRLRATVCGEEIVKPYTPEGFTELVAEANKIRIQAAIKLRLVEADE